MEEVASKELGDLFVKGEQKESHVGTTLRQIWEDDKRAKHRASDNAFKENQEEKQ